MTANCACLQAPMMLLYIWTSSMTDAYTTPKVVNPGRTEVRYYNKQDKVQMSCSATGQPQPTYKWRQKETEIQQSTTINVNSATGALTIPSFSGNQVGKYRCIASNIIDSNTLVSSMSPHIHLLMLKLETLSPGNINITDAAQEYTYLKMTCGDTRASVAPDLTYTWHEMENRTVLGVDQGRMSVDITGNLHIAYIRTKDNKIKGLACGVSATVGGRYQTSFGVRHILHVTNNPTWQRVRPVFRYSNTVVKARINSTARLECIFSGYDPHQPQSPLQTWRFPTDQAISIRSNAKYNVSEFGRMLFIKNVEEADERQYICAGMNTAGMENSTVFLDVTSGPIFTNGPPVDRTVLEGRDVQISCAARSLPGEAPPTQYEWYFNSVKIGQQYDHTKFSISSNREVLTIKNPSNTMCIQCEVTNHVDTTFANVCINVKVAIRIVRQPPAIQNISYGNVVDLTVTATTDATLPLNYRWQLNSTVYHPVTPPHVVFNSSNNHAYIATKTLTKAQYTSIGGLYKITLYNTNDSKTVTTMVNLAPPPVGPSFPRGPPPNLTAIEGSDAHFHCNATIALDEDPLRPNVWYVQGDRITSTYDRSKYGLSNGDTTFTIKKVNKDMHNNKCIRCEVSNGLDTISANACLRVLLPIRILTQPPATQNIQYKGLVNLTVKATTDPAMTLSYRWTFNGTTFDSASRFVVVNDTSQETYINTSYLTVDQFHTIEGLYTITIYHMYESKCVETEVVALSPTEGPFFAGGPPPNQTVIQGSDVLIECEAKVPPGEKPLQHNVWYAAGSHLHEAYDQNKFHISTDYNTLTLKKVRKGTVPILVRCEVSNGVDSIVANIYVDVLLPITIVKHPPEIQRIQKGDTVDLTVHATTDPSMTLHYRWQFENATFNGNITAPYLSYNLTTREAYIDTRLMTMGEFEEMVGVYSIIIYHDYENKTVTTNVTRLIPTPTESSRLLSDLWIVLIVLGSLLLNTATVLLCYGLCVKRRSPDKTDGQGEEGNTGPPGRQSASTLSEPAHTEDASTEVS